jgi:hypothetical protein
MPIRGVRPFMPEKPSKPTGIFSTNGKQKLDSTERFTLKGVKDAAIKTNPPMPPKKRDNRIKGG